MRESCRECYIGSDSEEEEEEEEEEEDRGCAVGERAMEAAMAA